MEAGEIIYGPGQIQINNGLERKKFEITNPSDIPIYIGSHFHLAEINENLKIDREKTAGFHLDIPAGDVVFLPPGSFRQVYGVPYSGLKERKRRKRRKTPLCEDQKPESDTPIYRPLERAEYARRYGPTAGDRIVLADTSIIIEIENDFTVYGEELSVNFGGSMRAGMGQIYGIYSPDEVDTVITNAVIFDAQHIVKADIGIKNGVITRIGKAGNPELMRNVNIIVGCHTTVIDAAGLIVTPGSVLTNACLESSGLLENLVNSGVTTVIGGAGTSTMASISGAFNTLRFLDVMDGAPLNFILTGNFCGTSYQLSEESCLFGANLVHDIRGSTPTVIDASLAVAENAKIPCLLVPDTMNESGLVEDTIKSTENRSIIVPDLDGTEGGHLYQMIRMLGADNVIGGTSVTAKPFTKFTQKSLGDIMSIRYRNNTDKQASLCNSIISHRLMYATEKLHDLGCIPLMTGSSLLPYASAEIATRTWRLASINRTRYGVLPGDNTNDNIRAKRYIAKYTSNPAIAHGIQHLVGLITQGLMADLAVWDPKSFGLTPVQVFKSGVPVLTRIAGIESTDHSFIGVSPTTFDKAEKYVTKLKLDLRHSLTPIGRAGTRDAMLNNKSKIQKLEIDPQTLEVIGDGETISSDHDAPSKTPLALNYT